MVDKQIKTFNCLRCNEKVIDGEEGMLELGLCYNCIELVKLELEEENNYGKKTLIG